MNYLSMRAGPCGCCSNMKVLINDFDPLDFNIAVSTIEPPNAGQRSSSPRTRLMMRDGIAAPSKNALKQRKRRDWRKSDQSSKKTHVFPLQINCLRSGTYFSAHKHLHGWTSSNAHHIYERISSAFLSIMDAMGTLTTHKRRCRTRRSCCICAYTSVSIDFQYHSLTRIRKLTSRVCLVISSSIA